MSPTTDRTRQGLTIGAAALAVSAAGDILERTVPERLGLALGIGALVLAIGYVLTREPELDAPHPGFAPARTDLAAHEKGRCGTSFGSSGVQLNELNRTS